MSKLEPTRTKQFCDQGLVHVAADCMQLHPNPRPTTGINPEPSTVRARHAPDCDANDSHSAFCADPPSRKYTMCQLAVSTVQWLGEACWVGHCVTPFWRGGVHCRCVNGETGRGGSHGLRRAPCFDIRVRKHRFYAIMPLFESAQVGFARAWACRLLLTPLAT